MAATVAFSAAAGEPGPAYERHRPEDSVLYQVLAEHWPSYRTEVKSADSALLAVQRDHDGGVTQKGQAHGLVEVRARDVDADQGCPSFRWRGRDRILFYAGTPTRGEAVTIPYDSAGHGGGAA